MTLAERIKTAIDSRNLKQKEVAAACGAKPSSINNLLSGKSKSMSAEVAYGIAGATGVEIGWLIHGRGPMRPAYPKSIGVMEVAAPNVGTGHPVPHLNIHASMGGGAYVDPEHEVVRYIAVDLPALRRRVSFTSHNKLSFITGQGDSMLPTFSDGDPLLIDTGVREHNTDAVYALTLNGRLYVKTLQRRPDGALLMISDNRKYDAYVIRQDDEVEIHGRVLLAWNARRI